MEFKSFPNQQRLKINKPQYKSGAYTVIGIESNTEALRKLSGSAYKVFMYLCSNSDKYEFWLSTALVCEKTGLSQNTCRKAIKELKENGYLQKNNDEFILNFYDKPRRVVSKTDSDAQTLVEPAQNLVEKIKKQRVDNNIQMPALNEPPTELNSIFLNI